MKKILLATTILGLSAGYASAEISWSASAAAGIATANGYDANDYYDAYDVYSSMKIGIKGSGETDGGLTFSAAMDMTTGTTFGRGDDLGDGFEGNDTYDDENGSFAGQPTISIGGAFGTISFSQENIDFFDDEHDGDVKYVGTFGAITLGAVADIDDSEYSVQLGYSADGLAVSMDTDSYDFYNASVAYTMGAVTAKVSTTNNDGGNAGDVINTVKLSYAADAISASISMNDSEDSSNSYTDDDYTVTAGYTANGLTIGVEYSYDNYYDVDYTKVTGSYDLGAGLTLEAGADSDESSYLGAAMKF